MSYLPELHRCAWCHCDLGAENGDGTCAECDAKVVECVDCGEYRMPDQPCAVCVAYGKDMGRDPICNCGTPLDGSHDHTTCGPPVDFPSLPLDAEISIGDRWPDLGEQGTLFR